MAGRSQSSLLFNPPCFRSFSTHGCERHRGTRCLLGEDGTECTPLFPVRLKLLPVPLKPLPALPPEIKELLPVSDKVLPVFAAAPHPVIEELLPVKIIGIEPLALANCCAASVAPLPPPRNGDRGGSGCDNDDVHEIAGSSLERLRLFVNAVLRVVAVGGGGGLKHPWLLKNPSVHDVLSEVCDAELS